MHCSTRLTAGLCLLAAHTGSDTDLAPEILAIIGRPSRTSEEKRVDDPADASRALDFNSTSRSDK